LGMFHLLRHKLVYRLFSKLKGHVHTVRRRIVAATRVPKGMSIIPCRQVLIFVWLLGWFRFRAMFCKTSFVFHVGTKLQLIFRMVHY
jgi:hypothetical protein